MRRWWGLTLMVIALLATISVPAVASGSVPGLAVAAPVPGAPRVGDCLLGRTTSPMLFGRGSGSYPALDLTGCDGARYGEVVDVLPNADPDTAPEARPGNSSDDPARRACTAAGQSYLGLADISPAVLDAWRPAVKNQTTPVAPSRRQQAAGQTWLACVLWIPAMWDGSVKLDGSAKDAVFGGRYANVLGSCVVGWTWSDVEPMSCAAPHRTEVLGTSRHTGTIRRSTAEAGCLELARELTRTADPTAGGRLRVALRGASDTEPGDVVDGAAFCTVQTTGNDVLVGSLLGLGARPLPIR